MADTIKKLVIQADAKGFEQATQKHKQENSEFEKSILLAKRYRDALQAITHQKEKLAAFEKRATDMHKADEETVKQTTAALGNQLKMQERMILQQAAGEAAGVRSGPGILSRIGGGILNRMGFRGLGGLLGGGGGAGTAGAGATAAGVAGTAGIALIVANFAFAGKKMLDATMRIIELSGAVGRLNKQIDITSAEFRRYAAKPGGDYGYTRAESLGMAEALAGRAGARGVQAGTTTARLARAFGFAPQETAEFTGRAIRLGGTARGAGLASGSLMSRTDLAGRDLVTNRELLSSMQTLVEVQSRGGIVISDDSMKNLADEMAAAQKAAISLGLPGITGERAAQALGEAKEGMFAPRTAFMQVMATRAAIDVLKAQGITPEKGRAEFAVAFKRVREGTMFTDEFQTAMKGLINTTAQGDKNMMAVIAQTQGLNEKMADAQVVTAGFIDAAKDSRTDAQINTDIDAAAEKASADERRDRQMKGVEIEAERLAELTKTADIYAKSQELLGNQLKNVGDGAKNAAEGLGDFTKALQSVLKQGGFAGTATQGAMGVMPGGTIAAEWLKRMDPIQVPSE